MLICSGTNSSLQCYDPMNSWSVREVTCHCMKVGQSCLGESEEASKEAHESHEHTQGEKGRQSHDRLQTEVREAVHTNQLPLESQPCPIPPSPTNVLFGCVKSGINYSHTCQEAMIQAELCNSVVRKHIIKYAYVNFALSSV